MEYPSNMGRLTNFQLDSLFREKTWSNLSFSDRYQACQELENRLASARNAEPRVIVLRNMSGAVYGEQYGNKINLNSHLLTNGCFVIKDNEDSIVKSYPVYGAGWQIYETICHEDEHGAQLDRGVYQTTASYIQCNSDRSLYRIQPDEARAFQVGQALTLRAIDQQISYRNEIDPDMRAYMDSVRSDRYEDALEDAKLRYGDENIEQTIQQFVNDREHGIVSNCSLPSYNAMVQIVWNQHQNMRQESLYEGAVSGVEYHSIGGAELGYTYGIGNSQSELPYEIEKDMEMEYDNDGSKQLLTDNQPLDMELDNDGSERLIHDDRYNLEGSYDDGHAQLIGQQSYQVEPSGLMQAEYGMNA